MSERELLIRAAARNHTSWMTAEALAAGGTVERQGSLRWLGGRGGHATLPFPRRLPRPGLDAMLDWCRRHGAGGVGCWVTGLEPAGELAARLVARGFEWGWQPHWMALDLDRLPLEETDARVALVTAVPEYGPGTGRALLELVRRHPQRYFHAVARVDGAYAGHATAHVVGGQLGGAGIYDVDVVPSQRRRGLGRSLTLAVCRAAAQAGARTATLNATGPGELLYRALGFRSLGLGQTWWIHRAGLRKPPPPGLVAAAEAAGRGDIRALERLDPAPEWRLPGNGLTSRRSRATPGTRGAVAVASRSRRLSPAPARPAGPRAPRRAERPCPRSSATDGSSSAWSSPSRMCCVPMDVSPRDSGWRSASSSVFLPAGVNGIRPPVWAAAFERTGPERGLHTAADLVEVDPQQREGLGIDRARTARVLAQPRGVEAEPAQRPTGGAGRLCGERDQQVLGADVAGVQGGRLVLGEHDDLPGRIRESLEHQARPLRDRLRSSRDGIRRRRAAARRASCAPPGG